MRRLNFLEDEPWDEVEDDKRVRSFGHTFGAVAWVATRHPERPAPEADEGVIARFDMPRGE